MPHNAAMRRIVTLLLALLACIAHPAAAQQVVMVVEEYWEDVLPGDPDYADALLESEVFPELYTAAAESAAGSERFVASAPAPLPRGVAAYGPFRVLDGTRAALVDVTDARSPAAFAALLAAYPGISTIEMLDCPGTEDDRANMRLGHMIRARGIATHVPRDGFVGSGAVELFLAGANRQAEPGAQFAVHSWQDENGREPRHFAANAPENRAYLDYYRAMGMDPARAAAFYAMTNSVPFASARWLTAAEMTRWAGME